MYWRIIHQCLQDITASVCWQVDASTSGFRWQKQHQEQLLATKVYTDSRQVTVRSFGWIREHTIQGQHCSRASRCLCLSDCPFSSTCTSHDGSEWTLYTTPSTRRQTQRRQQRFDTVHSLTHSFCDRRVPTGQWALERVTDVSASEVFQIPWVKLQLTARW